MDIKPNLEELLDTFLNKEEVEKLVKTPVTFYQYKTITRIIIYLHISHLKHEGTTV